ncbi:MAG: MarR family winged helix-turn-helix transcriptional regulator, partial [Pseudobdellovibrio sp.]
TNQLWALIFIDYYKNSNINELSSYLYISISTTSRLIDSLVKKKLVVRMLCETDHRVKVLGLTDKGKDYLEIIKTKRKEAWLNYAKQITASDIAAAKEHLLRIV